MDQPCLCEFVLNDHEPLFRSQCLEQGLSSGRSGRGDPFCRNGFAVTRAVDEANRTTLGRPLGRFWVRECEQTYAALHCLLYWMFVVCSCGELTEWKTP